MSQGTGTANKKADLNAATNKQTKQDIDSKARVSIQAAGPKIIPRTLPREILKWIQMLDLSYSVQDVRKDLVNGFLVAEIFQRYYPLKVQMHSFDNSHKYERRKNNWTLLQLMFTKSDIPITKADWEAILEKEDTEVVNSFMAKIFNILTQKKFQFYLIEITKPPLANYVNSKEFLAASQTMQSGATASYLLKDKGLERLDEKKQDESIVEAEDKDKDKKLDGSMQSENKVQITNHSSKRTNFLRVPSKPISQNIESLTHQIDVKGITVKQVQGSILKLRENKMLPNEQQNAQELTAGVERFGNIATNKSLLPPHPSNNNNNNNNNSQSQDNQLKSQTQMDSVTPIIQFIYLTTILDQNQGYMSSTEGKKKQKHVEQTIMDILNNMLMIRFQQGQYNEELKKIKGKNINLASSFADQVDEFSDEFVSSFLNEILQQKDAFISFLFKETNNLWTFFNFCFTCLFNLSHTKNSLLVLGEFIKGFGEKSLQRDPNKTKNIFVEFFLPSLADCIKQSVFFQKKEVMIQTIYYFCPNDPASKHAMISSVKECLKDMNSFMQVLVVLFKFEESYTEYNRLIFDDFLLFANQNLFSSSTNLSTMSLAIFSHAADLRPDLILSQLINKIDAIAKNQWWECKCLAIIVFSKVIKGILNSDKYISLVKNPSANQKFFSIENERMISEMKEQVDKFARGIFSASFPSSSAIILSTTFIYIVEHIGECKILLDLFLNLIMNCSQQTRYWVLHSDEDNFKDNNNNTLHTSGFHSQLNVSNEKIEINGQPRQQQNNVPDEEDKEQIEQLNMLNNPSQHKESETFQYLIYSSRSLKYKSQINSAVIKQFASQILQLFVQFVKEHEKELEQLSQEHMDIVLFGFENTDFKVINMESCETIANTLKEYILISLCDSALCHQGKTILFKLLDLQFFSDVKLADSENLFGSTIGLIYKNQIQETMENMEEVVSHLVEQGYSQGSEVVKQFLVDSVSYLYKKQMIQYVENTKMIELLAQPIASYEETQSHHDSQQNQSIDQYAEQQQPQLLKPPSNGDNAQRKSQQSKQDQNAQFSNMQMIQEKPHEREDSIVAE